MPSDYDETQDVNDTTTASDVSSSEPRLTDEGISAMQGSGSDSSDTGADHLESSTHEREFTDTKGRQFTLRSSESANRLQVNAIDENSLYKSYGVGRANAKLEPSYTDEPPRVRFGDIEVQPEYRGAGISNEMVNEVERFARARGASEIYGTIEDQDARSYWEHQAQNGWQIRPGNSAHGEVFKHL